MELKKGGTYRDEYGNRVGPLKGGMFKWVEGKGHDPDAEWGNDGKVRMRGPEGYGDLIAEWTEGPVRTVTRREVVAGSYGRLKTLKVSPSGVSYTKAVVSLEERFYSREDLTEIIDLLAEVRDGLELAGALPDGE